MSITWASLSSARPSVPSYARGPVRRHKLLALDGVLAKAEPKTLRYRILHAAARLVRRRRYLKIAAAWPWAGAITAAWQRIQAIPQAP
jgi:hypothetical protein